jgi:hypothetical protein
MADLNLPPLRPYSAQRYWLPMLQQANSRMTGEGIDLNVQFIWISEVLVVPPIPQSSGISVEEVYLR